MKKGLKKTLAAVIALTMLMSMSVCAFAVNLNVTTEYTAGASTVSVTAAVTGVEGENQQVAFLAKKGNDIIWIDQQPAVSNAASSVFTTSKDNVGAIVSVGTTSVASSAVTATKNAIELPTYKVEYSLVAEEGAVLGDTTVVASTGASGSTTTDYVTFTVYPAAGLYLKSVTADGSDVAWIDGSTKKVAVTKNTEYVFTFAKKEVAEITSTPAKPATAPVATETTEGENTVKTATVFGNAVGAAEYGILVVNAENADAIDALDAAGIAALSDEVTEGVRKYKALGANEEGNYAIVLKEIKSGDAYGFFNGTSYIAKMYALNGTYFKLSDAFTIQ